METVLRTKSGDDESDARKMLMLHASKADANPNIVSNLFVHCSKMTIRREIHTQLEDWKVAAIEVIQNKHVNEVILRCIEEYGVNVEQSTSGVVKIVYVNNSCQNLRGFSGINEVYINAVHFLLSLHVYDAIIADKHDLELRLQVDIINVAIHELAHLQLRKAMNDFNTSYPILAKSNALPDNYLEFGRYVEEQIFGAPVDWMESDVDVHYLESIVSSVKSDSPIPKLTNVDEIIVREYPLLMALDYKNSQSYC
ncbi:uncharacterized protein LOC119084991 [Bradysia coprophila]|uniref:uncharacterized protein LOC119084991 n=1 Tax=Bradysia coprophila TaxID=38358 RepID=UPI00187D9B52|nr:uncharacterized protein LOC119084991 [Bradysia coprophila]